MDQSVKLAEERSIVCYSAQEEKIHFEGFTENGCYGPQPFEFIALTPTVPVLLQNEI